MLNFFPCNLCMKLYEEHFSSMELYDELFLGMEVTRGRFIMSLLSKLK